MKNTGVTILVPYDFSQVADYALQHAIRVSQVVNQPITLLHIVNGLSDHKLMQEKLSKVASQSAARFGLEPIALIKEGSIFVQIAEVAREINASMVIMGSHSIRGKEEISGSLAHKVIISSSVPFVTIQEPPINKRYDEIIFPIDFTEQNREKHSWISYFCTYYVSRFHLIKPYIVDPQLQCRVDLNMASARKFLDELGAKYIEYDVKGEKNYAEEVLEIAVNIRADLIVLMTTPKDNEDKFIVEPHEQFIIANAGHIPVMSINPTT
ncbi:universal stress protein [Williamwhitmania taraxaci]|uniref:Nucleotide-binding universal stress protein, UspA family n=1 Tax=Williamwhitmania taraxaci TaxID=1640674 RepID=A0A1G6P0D0_9BACT|nr:universal stress protein [Williamwhitmania taraxaci]SDC73458.1 Nucleotide-binding universal stress protein, UspA family [Williamwhitmania taraxaci]